MVNIPFVSEDFQRAFRNQFPSQTQTGRDLHVSDIVIPIVDFSPTASGASLPFELRDTYNPSATFANYNTAQTNTEVIGTPGFWSLRFNISYNGGSFSPSVIFNFKTTSTGTSAKFYQKTFLDLPQFGDFSGDLKVFLPVDKTVTLTLTANGADTVNYASSVYQLADVNGNLTNPSGYDPQ